MAEMYTSRLFKLTKTSRWQMVEVSVVKIHQDQLFPMLGSRVGSPFYVVWEQLLNEKAANNEDEKEKITENYKGFGEARSQPPKYIHT